MKSTAKHGRPVRMARVLTGIHQSTDKPISIAKIIGRPVRTWLLTEQDHTNKYEYLRQMVDSDPTVGLAIDYLANMINRNYLGPVMFEEEEGFQPTPGFLNNINRILSEMGLTTNIYDAIYHLVMEGDLIFRVWRVPRSFEIRSIELIAPDAVSIISRDMLKGDSKKDGIIQSADYYIINEAPERKTAYSIGGDFAQVPYGGDMQDEMSSTSSAPDNDFEEIVLPATEIIHVAIHRTGSNVLDRLGRQTYGIWGQSVLRSLSPYVKGKLNAFLDYQRWFRMGMPRQVVNIDLGELADPAQYEGVSAADQQVAAEAAVQIEFDKVTDMFFYVDDDPESATYQKTLPMEPDDVLMLTEGVSTSIISGNSPGPEVRLIIKEANREIAARLGIPQTLAGYESGSTYAVGRVTSEFMAGYGGGLLRSLEKDLFKFLKAEFVRRGYASKANDWDNLYLDYEVDTTDRELQKATAETAKATASSAIATMISTLFAGELITKNEARAIISELVDGLGGLPPVEDGDEFKMPAPQQTSQFMMEPRALSRSSDEKEEVEAIIEIRRIFENAYRDYVEVAADMIESGTMED